MLVFDGVSDARIGNASVQATGNPIEVVWTQAIDAPHATVIDGGGRTLTPGFIELHARLMLMGSSLPAMEANTTREDFAIHVSLMAGATEEIKAAVQVSGEYGSHILAHSCRKEAIQSALEAGVLSIEHGFSFDCEIAEVMNEKAPTLRPI